MTEPRDPNEPRPPLDDDWFTPFDYGDDDTSTWPAEDLTAEPPPAGRVEEPFADEAETTADTVDEFDASDSEQETGAEDDAISVPASGVESAPAIAASLESADPAVNPGLETVEAAPPPPEQSFDAYQPWDTKRWGDRRRPTTAEQAVPWLVGLVLALAGIVIVLLVLIFSDANGGFAASSSASPGLSQASGAVASPTPTPEGSASTSGSKSPSAKPTAKPTPAPSYGALEMEYLTRPSALGASELLHNDFASAAAATVVDRSSADVNRYAISPDGTATVAIVNGKLFAFQRHKPAKTLASGIDAVTFGSDAGTVYAVKASRHGASDTAVILAITVRNSDAKRLATITYAHPGETSLTTLDAARFADDGGTYRIYATTDGNLLCWIANAGQWRIDPASGDKQAATRPPILWSPQGEKRITMGTSGGLTTLAVINSGGDTSARVTVTGVVSHLRWSPNGKKIVFTLGRSLAGGGVRQDLYLWDLVDGHAPTALTSNGSSFGADWLGAAQFWEP
jgi:WD40-like Beta Propeller Repeat